MEKYKEVERSIIKKFRKDIWSKFIKAIQEYELIQDNDKIMVCISGGKDSFLMAKCIQELERHGKKNFEAFYVVMDPGYSDYNRDLILNNAKDLNIPIEMFESNIFEVVSSVSDSPCYLCARMRRGCLYNKAKELGCNKIALGHHFDDVIETTLLSIFYGSEVKTMMPKLHSENFCGLELIRPLYLVKEESVLAWKKFNELTFINCACKFTEEINLKDGNKSKREEVKKLIKKLRMVNKDIDHNIFKALDNINLNCVLGIKKDGIYKSFLEGYDNKKKDVVSKHPYLDFIPEGATKLIIGSIPPFRFCIKPLNIYKDDVRFFYGSKDNNFWKLIEEVTGKHFDFENTDKAIEQRKKFLEEYNLGMTDIVEKCIHKDGKSDDKSLEIIDYRRIDKLLLEDRCQEIDTLICTSVFVKNKLNKYASKGYQASSLNQREGIIEINKKKYKVIVLYSPSRFALRGLGYDGVNKRREQYKNVFGK